MFPQTKSGECCHLVKIGLMTLLFFLSNFMLASDEIGFLIQNFKTLDQLKVEKWLIHPVEALIKFFSSKKKKGT